MIHNYFAELFKATAKFIPKKSPRSRANLQICTQIPCILAKMQ